LPVTELFNPVLPAFLCGIAFVLLIAYRLGKKEKQRLGDIDLAVDIEQNQEMDEEKQNYEDQRCSYSM